ncbi:hypothetical protein EP7_001830 [Isosphaeraceae bacterium EP7]
MIQSSHPAAMRRSSQQVGTLQFSSAEMAWPLADARGHRDWKRGPKFVACAAAGFAAWSRDFLYLAAVGIPMVDESYDARRNERGVAGRRPPN